MVHSNTRTQHKAFNDIYTKYADRIRRRAQPCSFAREAMIWLNTHNAQMLLDMGCGAGGNTVFFAQQGYEVYCLDFSVKGIALCRENICKNQVQHHAYPLLADIERTLPFVDHTFGSVFAHLSLHYFSDDVTTRIFSDVYRVLKPQGLFFVKVKSVDDPLCGHGTRLGEDMFEFHHVRHFYSQDYLEHHLRQFTILHLRHTRESAYADPRVSTESAFIEAIGKKAH